MTWKTAGWPWATVIGVLMSGNWLRNGFSKGGVEGLVGPTVTVNDCDVLVFVEASNAETVTFEVSPAVAPVVSMWTTPSGFVGDSVAELILIAPTGSDFSPPPLVVTGTLSMSARMSEPATSWPKIV